MGDAVVADGDLAGFHELAQLRPAHVCVRRLAQLAGGGEQGERQVRRAQPGPGLAVDQFKGIVDGDRDGAVGQRFLVANRGDDLG